MTKGGRRGGGTPSLGPSPVAAPCVLHLLPSQQMTLLGENSRGNEAFPRELSKLAFPPPLGCPSDSARLHLPACLGEELPPSLLKDNYFTVLLKPSSCLLRFAPKTSVSPLPSQHLSDYFFLGLQPYLSQLRFHRPAALSLENLENHILELDPKTLAAESLPAAARNLNFNWPSR